MNCIHRRTSRLLVYGDVLKRLQSSNVSTDIQIPNKIERSSTDILRALEATISRDYTAPRYKFHDDPYLIPQSTQQTRSFALARESGKKAAMWIHKEHANLFQHKIADPMIESFVPPVVYNDKSQITEKVLLNIILNGEVEEAINVYNLLQPVSAPTKLALLELLCFCNGETLFSSELLEEKWFSNIPVNKMNTWKSHPKIEELFESLKLEGGPITFAAYNALICGTAKYLDCNKAWELYEECKEKKIPFSLKTYNYLIQLAPFLKEDFHLQKQLILDLLGAIASDGITPNTMTLSACIKSAHRLKNRYLRTEFIRTLFAEFLQLDIKLSLSTYYYLILTFYNRDNNASNAVIMSILHKLENQSLTIMEDTDTLFLSTAMNIAERLEDRSVADKIHSLLLFGDNYKFIGDNQKENMYYRSYTRLMLKTELFEDFMEFYMKLVPNVYIPEMSVMDEIVYHLEISTPKIRQEYLPKIWSQVVMFNFLDKPVAFRMISMMRTNFPQPLECPLYVMCKDAVNTIWSDIKIKCQRDYVLSKWTAELLADIAVLFTKYNNFDTALEVIEFALMETGLVVGVIEDKYLTELCNAFILQGHSLGVFNLIQYALANDSEQALTMAQRLNEQVPLSEQERNKLIGLVGNSVLEMKSSLKEMN